MRCQIAGDREWLGSVGRETGRDGCCRLQYARESEKSFLLMSEFFASFVTGSVGIPVETRGIRWIVFLVAPPPPSSRVMEMTQNISYARLFSASL